MNSEHRRDVRLASNTPKYQAANMWRRWDHDRREYRPHRHQGVGRGINPLRGQIFCPREDNTSLIVNCQSSIVNRQSSIINRLSPVVERLILVLAAVGSIPCVVKLFASDIFETMFP